MTKFNEIISRDDQEVIQSIFSILDIRYSHKVNIVETLENIVYLHPTHFKSLTKKEKITIFTTLLIIVDTLIDEEINPLSKKLLLQTFNCFNNNIFSNYESTCDAWDEYNQRCMLDNVEKI